MNPKTPSKMDRQEESIVTRKDLERRVSDLENRLAEAQTLVERFQTMVDDQADVFCRFDPQGRITYLNKAFREACGWKEHESYGRHIDDIPLFQKKESIDLRFAPLTRENQVNTSEVQWIAPTGDSHWYQWVDRAIYDAFGELAEYESIGRDITLRKRAEDALRSSENLLRTVFDVADVGLVLTDTSGTIIRVNRLVLERGEYLSKEVLGFPIFTFVSPDIRALAEEKFKKAAQNDITISGEWTVFTKNEQKLILETRTRRLTGPGGELLLITSINDITKRVEAEKCLRDAGDLLDERVRRRTAELMSANAELKKEISQREKIEEALKAAEKRYGALFHGSNDPVFIHWLAHDRFLGEPLDVNEVAVTVLGYERDELLMPATTIWNPEQEADMDEVRKKLREQGHALFEIQLVTKNGLRIPMEFNSHLFELNGLPTVLSVARDITKRKREEEEILRAKAAADEASLAKSEFLANMSHEIRTPMNGIIGMINLALDTKNQEEQEDYLTLARSSAETLLHLLNDILDFSKIEAGQLHLERVPFDLRETLAKPTDTIALECDFGKVELCTVIHPEVPDVLVGDPVRLQQILINLLGNAVKFTSSGEIVLEVGVKSRRDRGIVLSFEVRDTGIGVEPELQQRIFHAFAQADPSTARKYGGTGLGLAITSNLVKRMGGSMTLDSEPGVGSRFRFDIDLETDQNKTPSLESIGLTGKKAVIIAENDNLVKSLVEQLAYWGIQAEVHDVNRGVRPLMDGAWDTLLIDSGLKASLSDEIQILLKKSGGLADNRLIWMVPVGRKKGDSVEEFTGSCVLSKPVYRDNLYDAVLLSCTNQKRLVPDKASETENARASGRFLNILLAEDNPVNQLLTVRLLERKGHRVTVAADGFGALDFLEKNRYDLILMDVQMPGMDGIRTTTEIRKREADGRAPIPIIALTAHAIKGDREKFLDAGMNGYLAKPIDPDKMFDMIEKIAGFYEDAIVPGDQNEEDIDRIWSRMELLERVGFDEDLFIELILVFLQDLPTRMAVIGEVSALPETDLLQSEAHSLKGSAASIGAKGIRDAAFSLETACKENDLCDLEASLDQLRREAELIQPILQNEINRAGVNGSADRVII